MEPTDRKALKVKACESCKKEFTLTRIRHTCKRCYRVICSDCGKARIKIVTYDLKTAHKVCPFCEKENIYQVNFRTTNQSFFAKISRCGQKWLDKLNPQSVLSKSPTDTYEEYRKAALDPQTVNEHFSTIERDVAEGRTDRAVYNYSVQEFLFYNQEKTTPDKVREATKDILKAFVLRHPHIGYCQGMSYIVNFFLGLLDEQSTFWMLSYLVTKILPSDFFTASEQGIPMFGFQLEKYVITNLAKFYLNLDDPTTEKVSLFLEANGPSMLIPLYLTYLNFEVAFETMNKLIMDSDITILRQLALKLIELFIEYIKLSPLLAPTEIQAVSCKNINANEFKNALKISIVGEEVEKLIKTYREELTSKWVAKNENVYHHVSRLMNFNKQELSLLLGEYNKYITDEKKKNKKATPETDGMSPEQFGKLLQVVIAKDATKQKEFESIEMQKMFNIFDVDRNGKLDFKEFLCSLGMLMQGTVDEKMQYTFGLLDASSKGYLNGLEFESFLDTIMNVALISNSGDFGAFFNHDADLFFSRVRGAPKNKDKVKYADVAKEILNGRFLQYCGDEERRLTRAKTLQRVQSFMNPDKITEVDTNNETTFREESTLDATLGEQGDTTKEHALDRLESVEESKIEEPLPESQTELKTEDETSSPTQRAKKEAVVVAEDPAEVEGKKDPSLYEFGPDDMSRSSRIIDDDQDDIYQKRDEETTKIEDMPKLEEMPIVEEKLEAEEKVEVEEKVVVEEKANVEETATIEATKTETTEEIQQPKEEEIQQPKDEETNIRKDSEIEAEEMAKMMQKWKSGSQSLANIESPKADRAEEIIYENFGEFFPLLSDNPDTAPTGFTEEENKFFSCIDKPLLTMDPNEILMILKKPVAGGEISPFTQTESYEKNTFTLFENQTFFNNSCIAIEPAQPVAAMRPIKRPFSSGTLLAVQERDIRGNDAPTPKDNIFERVNHPQEHHHSVHHAAPGQPVGKKFYENFIEPFELDERASLHHLSEQIFKPDNSHTYKEHDIPEVSAPGLTIEKKIYENIVQPFELNVRAAHHVLSDQIFKADHLRDAHEKVLSLPPGLGIEKKIHDNHVEANLSDPEVSSHILTDIFKVDELLKEHDASEPCAPGRAIGKVFYDNHIHHLELDVKHISHDLSEDIFKADHLRHEHEKVEPSQALAPIEKKIYENHAEVTIIHQAAESHVFSTDLFKADEQAATQEKASISIPAHPIGKKIYENHVEATHLNERAQHHELSHTIFEAHNHTTSVHEQAEFCPPALKLGKVFYDNHAESSHLDERPHHHEFKESIFETHSHSNLAHEPADFCPPGLKIGKVFFDNHAEANHLDDRVQHHEFKESMFEAHCHAPLVHESAEFCPIALKLGKVFFDNHAEAIHLNERSHHHEIKGSIFEIHSHSNLVHESVESCPIVLKLGKAYHDNHVQESEVSDKAHSHDLKDTVFNANALGSQIHESPVASPVALKLGKAFFDNPVTSLQADEKPDEVIFKGNDMFTKHDTAPQSQVPLSKPVIQRPNKIEAPAKIEEPVQEEEVENQQQEEKEVEQVIEELKEEIVEAIVEAVKEEENVHHEVTAQIEEPNEEDVIEKVEEIIQEVKTHEEHHHNVEAIVEAIKEEENVHHEVTAQIEEPKQEEVIEKVEEIIQEVKTHEEHHHKEHHEHVTEQHNVQHEHHVEAEVKQEPKAEDEVHEKPHIQEEVSEVKEEKTTHHEHENNHETHITQTETQVVEEEPVHHEEKPVTEEKAPEAIQVTQEVHNEQQVLVEEKSYEAETIAHTHEESKQVEERPPREFSEDIIVDNDEKEPMLMTSGPTGQHTETTQSTHHETEVKHEEKSEDLNHSRTDTFFNASIVENEESKDEHEEEVAPLQQNMPIATSMNTNERPSQEVLVKRKQQAEQDRMLEKKGGDNCKVCNIF